MKKILLSIISILNIIYIFLNNNLAFANSYVFKEDFSNTLDSKVWQVYQNSGNLFYSNNQLNLSTTDVHHYPYIHSIGDLFPNGNFSIEWAFQYLTQYHGTGIAITDILPSKDQATGISKDNVIFNTWVTGNEEIALGSSICPSNNPGCNWAASAYYISKNDMYKYNKFRVDYINGVYYAYFNENLLLTSANTTRIPRFVWIGTPIYSSNGISNWSSFSIDYIKINKLPDKELDVPYFSQNDSQWGSDTYDHMTETIDQKGCAMTSATMLLNYYGIDVTPNNDPMNPKTLNEWLINKIPQEGLMGNAKGYTLDGGINWIAVNQLARFFDPELTFYMFNGNLNQSNNTFPVFTSNINNNIPEILWISGNGTYWDDWSTHFIVGKGYDTENAYLNDPEDKHNSMPLNYEVKRRMAFYQDPNWDDWGTISITYPKQIALVLKDKQGKKLGKDLENNIYQEIDNSVFVEGNMYGGNFEDTHNALFLNKVELEAQYQIEVKSMESNDFKLEYNSLNTDNSAYVSLIEGDIIPNQINTYQLDFKNNAENSLKLLSIQKPQPDFDSIKKLIKDNKDKFKNKGIYNLLLTKINLAEFFYNHSNPKVVTIMLDFIIQTIEKPSKIIDENFRLVLLNAIWELKSLL